MSMRMDIGREERLEAKRRSVGNVIHKGAAAGCGEVREEGAIKNPARWPGCVRRLAIQSKFLCCGKEAPKPYH